MSWDLGNIDMTIRYKYLLVLNAALNAKPTPIFSNYFVREAALAIDGTLARGGNHESPNTTHGEDSLLSSMLDKTDSPIELIAILTQDGDAVPCGYCLDHVKQYILMGATILGAKPEGGPIITRKLKEFYFDEFREVPYVEMPGLDEAVKKYERSNDLFHKEKYGAAIVAEAGVFSAGLGSRVHYHHGYPLRRAISVFEEGTGIERLNVNHVVVAGVNPYVKYSDRQELRDLADILKAGGINVPIPVYIYDLNEKRLWVTDSHEWLPHPFSAANLGMQDQLKKVFELLQ
jgi:cytidine deaminase